MFTVAVCMARWTAEVSLPALSRAIPPCGQPPQMENTVRQCALKLSKFFADRSLLRTSGLLFFCQFGRIEIFYGDLYVTAYSKEYMVPQLPEPGKTADWFESKGRNRKNCRRKIKKRGFYRSILATPTQNQPNCCAFCSKLAIWVKSLRRVFSFSSIFHC